MTYKVKDFVNNIKNKSSFNIDDLISMAKRENNKKRDFLFVNNFLGKHIPAKGSEVMKLFEEFYLEIKHSKLLKGKKVLVIGFAETATALGESVVYYWNKDKNKDFEIVSYAQTTRENVDWPDCLYFEEEHSHATSQKLYYDKNLNNFDTILFVEDEITTGQTILNCLDLFEKVFDKEINFVVSSILNWQNNKNKKRFFTKEVETISLISGEMKDEFPKIEISTNFEDEVKHKEKKENKQSIFKSNNIRVQKPVSYLLDKFNKLEKTIELQLPSSVKNYSMIGTEEFMFDSILASYLLDGYVRASTRSPITPSLDNEYPINTRIKFPSMYETNRVNYLYNILFDLDKYIVIFKDSFSSEEVFNDFKKNLLVTGIKSQNIILLEI